MRLKDNEREAPSMHEYKNLTLCRGLLWPTPAPPPSRGNRASFRALGGIHTVNLIQRFYSDRWDSRAKDATGFEKRLREHLGETIPKSSRTWTSCCAFAQVSETQTPMSAVVRGYP